MIVRSLSTRYLLDRMYEIECLHMDTGKMITAELTTLDEQEPHLTAWWKEYCAIVHELRYRGVL